MRIIIVVHQAPPPLWLLVLMWVDILVVLAVAAYAIWTIVEHKGNEHIRAQSAELLAQLKREQKIIKVMSVLPGTYRYAQVEEALNASGVDPEAVYLSLATGEHTIALARFYETLNASIGKIKPLSEESGRKMRRD